jgi:2-methylaconitate cis-trans-isomerase PrpF
MRQTRIPCVIMRGGSSRGPYFLASDLPGDVATRDAVLLAAMGSPHQLQVDGIGGANTLTSKVAIVSPSAEPDVDVDYLFAQVDIGKALVDTRPNCGNMLSGVGPFALEAGIVPATGDETIVRIRNKNTGALVEALVQTPGGEVTYEGTAEIPGVNGTAAPIMLRFREVAGAKTGKLFPTGHRTDVIDGVEVSMVDCAMPMMILRAADLGTSAEATPAEIDADRALLARIEAIRMEAGRRMGFGDVTDSVVPKVGLVGPTEGADFAVRYLTPHAVHKALAVTGAICLAAAAKCPGTTVHSVTKPVGDIAYIRHPGGVIEVPIAMNGEEDVAWAGMLRTARRIMEGTLLVPGRVWAGKTLAMAAE